VPDPILVQVDHHVALITVNDPDRRNAITADSSAALRAAVNAVETDPDVHAVIVTGAGKAFCAGADLTALGAATEDGLRRIYDGFLLGQLHATDDRRGQHAAHLRDPILGSFGRGHRHGRWRQRCLAAAHRGNG